MEKHPSEYQILVDKKTGMYITFVFENSKVEMCKTAYPELWGKYVFPEDIKKVILFSVDFNPNAPLAVRSGGFLNSERSMKMARIFNRKALTDEGLIRKVYCPHSVGLCKQAKDRIDFWKRTGLWSD